MPLILAHPRLCQIRHLPFFLLFVGLTYTEIMSSSTTLTVVGVAATPSRFITLPVARLDTNLSASARHQRRALYRERRRARIEMTPVRERRLAGYKEHAEISREPDGVYYTWVRIGTSEADGGGKAFSLIADTGSSTIAVPCKGCSCGSHNHFDPAASSTSQDTGRHYSQCYGEGSCNSGKIIRDVMCFGKHCPVIETVMMNFGCCSNFAPSFKEQEADGIIGLGHSSTLVSALQNNGDLLAHVFALCLGDNEGRLTVGGCELFCFRYFF